MSKKKYIKNINKYILSLITDDYIKDIIRQNIKKKERIRLGWFLIANYKINNLKYKLISIYNFNVKDEY